MSRDKPLFTLGFPVPLTSVGENPEDATLVHRPWGFREEDSRQETFDSSETEVSEDLFNLPEVPEVPTDTDPMGHTTPLKQAPRPRPMTSTSHALFVDEKQVIGGRYVIEARIGEGGMGRVYRVKHLELGKTFALKIMRSLLAADEAARKSFFREARLASSLSHPQIVSIVDFGEDPKFGAYMVMELLDGVPLRNALAERGRFGLRPACDLLLQIADAIRYVHEKGVVHCDIKAENVLLCEERTETGRRNYRVKLLDFGLARPHAEASQSMTIAGTPSYIAPERIRGASPAPSMDIYALGILFYELLTGAPPFTGSLHTVLAAHLTDKPTPPSEIMGTPLDESVEALLFRALAKNPEERQRSVGAFIYELRTAMEMLGFGRKRRVKGKSQVRNEVVDALFADCPLPLAAFDSTGTIVVGNKAFSIFLFGEPLELQGVALEDTPLKAACPEIVHHVRTVIAEGRAQKIELETHAQDGTSTNLLVWLTPGANESNQVFCAIHVVEG
jgi:hypothetical protein